MTEDKGFQLRNETVRTVNVKLNRRMYRRLALSASMNRRSLGKEAGYTSWIRCLAPLWNPTMSGRQGRW